MSPSQPPPQQKESQSEQKSGQVTWNKKKGQSVANLPIFPKGKNPSEH